MEDAIAFHKLRRNANDVVSDMDEESDEEDSYFELVFESPVRGREDAAKKEVVGVESPTDVFMSNGCLPESKPLSPVTILRPAPRMKVFMFGFRRSASSDSASDTGEVKASPLSKLLKSSKARASDIAVAPVFARDNSLRSRMVKDNSDYEACSDVVASGKSFPKYLRLINPFNARSSKKTKLIDTVTPSHSPVTAPVNLYPRKFSESGSRITSFKIAARSLGKSRTTSATMNGAPPVRRRDDSLLEQNDGIQGAILYCKKSYNSSSLEISQLIRSASDQVREKGRNPCEDLKRCSI